MKLLALCKLNYKKYILELALLIILFFALFVPNIFTRMVVAVFLLAYTIFATKILKNTETLSEKNKRLMFQMFIFGAIYVVAYYIMGIYFGYYINPVQFSIKTIITFILPLTVIIISSEILRNVFVHEKDKISNILVIIDMVLIEVAIYWQVYDLSNLNDFLVVLGLIIFASIACNLLYNYICSRFGYKPIIIYRLITVLYLYIIPVVPDVYTFFRAVLRMVYPYIIYLFLEYMYGKNKIIDTYKSRTIRNVNVVIIIIIAILTTMLISCKFHVGILAIGSGSMARTINKGDAVVFVKYTDQEISKGDVIVFKKNNITIVHRVTNVITNNGEKQYYTKGDNNESEDMGYTVDSDIVGISKFKIKYIGYPSLWLSDIFN